MKYQFKWYLNENSERATIAEWLDDALPAEYEDTPVDRMDDIVTAVRNYFYEVEFECEYDDETKQIKIDYVIGPEGVRLS